MDTNTIVSIISTLGFPIVACIGCGYMCKWLIEKYTAIITETIDALKDSIEDLRKDLRALQGGGHIDQ